MAPPVSDEDGLEGLVGVLRRHRALMAGCVATTVALAVAYTLYARPVFEATSVLRFELEQVNLPQVVQVLSTENRISTEIEVLRGRKAAEAVIDSLGLRARLIAPRQVRASRVFAYLRVAPTADTATLVIRPGTEGKFDISRAGGAPAHVTVAGGRAAEIAGVTLAIRADAPRAVEFRLQIIPLDAAVRRFASNLEVSRPARDADLIGIRFRSNDSIQAAAGANLLANHVIAGRQSVQRARTGSTIAYLSEQLDTLGRRLRLTENSLSDYRQRTGSVDPTEQARTQVGRLVQIQAERGAMKAEREALAQLLRQTRHDSAGTLPGQPSPFRRLISFPTLFRNQAASELLGALVRVENDRASLLVRRTAEDPDVRTLTDRIGEIDAQLRGIAETYLQGLTNQVAALDEVARGFGGALDSLPEKAVRTGRLEREVKIQQELYTLLQTRLKEAQITQAMEDPTVRIVDPAAVPDRPVRPRPLVNLVLALIIGSLLGVVAALAWEWTDRSVRSRRDAHLAAGLPVLGAIPRAERRLLHSRRPGAPRRSSGLIASLAETPGGTGGPATSPAAARIARRLVTRADAPASYTEAFNQLHANLALAYRDRPLKILLFTSPLPGEGKTLSVINFALTVAARGLRVLLIDGDLRCGLVNEVLACPREPGFAEVLKGTAQFGEGARQIAVADSGSLVVLPSGALLAAPGRLLVVERVRELLETLAPQFDLVLIDSPPVNLLADAAVLGSAADAVLLVVRAAHTRMEALRYAMDQLSAARAPVLGTLLNDIDLRHHGYDDGSYRYLSGGQYYASRR